MNTRELLRDPARAVRAIVRRVPEARSFAPAPSLERFRRRETALASRLLAGSPDPAIPFATQLEAKLDRVLRAGALGPDLLEMLEAFAAMLPTRAHGFFTASLVGSARSATRARRARGEVRSLWGTTPIISIIPAARAERAIGVAAETLVFDSYYITGDFDVNLKSLRTSLDRDRPELVLALHWLAFVWAVLRFDVFHFFNDRGILLPVGGYGSVFGINRHEMILLRRARKRLFTYTYGADNRTRARTLASGKYNFCMHCPDVGRHCVCDDAGAARMMRTISRYATAMVATGLSLDYVPRPVDLHYLAVDTDRLQPVFTPPPRDRPLRVVHAPNHPYFKGTHYLEQAVAKLQAEGRAIELVMLSGVSNERVLELVRSADVVADQFIGGAFGYFAIEAMALGKPVLCFVRDPSRFLAPDELPIVNADPDGLYAALKKMVEEPWALADLGRRSRAYVERHLSLPAFAERLRRLHLDFGRPSWAVYRRLVSPHEARPLAFVRTRVRGAIARGRHAGPLRARIAGAVERTLLAVREAVRQGKRHALAGQQAIRALRTTPSYWRALTARRPQGDPPSHEVVMLVVSDARSDPRVEREARALAGAGFVVKVIYPDAYVPRFAEKPIDWGPGISFRPAPADAGQYVMRFPWLWGGGLHGMALEERPLAFHSHDLNTALAALSAARRTGALLVVDFHEWHSENVSWNARRAAWLPPSRGKQALLRAVERHVMRQADGVVTVCESIATELTASAGGLARPVTVVRNIPNLQLTPTRAYRSLKEELGIPRDVFVLLWQGGVGPTRLIEPIIEALGLAPRTVFVVRGPGIELFAPGYRRLAQRHGVEDRLLLVPPVPSRDVVAAARGADAGIWTLPNWCKNFYYALPNKLFEYMAAGLPILAANFPEARRLVEGSDVGLCFEPSSPSSIAEALNRLAGDPELLARLRANVPGALAALHADDEWTKLTRLYRELASASGARLAAAPAARAADTER